MPQDKTIKLPRAASIASNTNSRTLPYNGNAVSEKSFSFSFSCFDRSHKLFNLGESTTPDKAVSGAWFLTLLDCFKDVCNTTKMDLKRKPHLLHPVDWKNANATAPQNSEQLEYWQFRLNKSRGRVIGFFIDSVFYIVWLDKHHNLCDSEGYGGVAYFVHPSNEYEILEAKLHLLQEENERLGQELEAANQLLGMH